MAVRFLDGPAVFSAPPAATGKIRFLDQPVQPAPAVGTDIGAMGFEGSTAQQPVPQPAPSVVDQAISEYPMLGKAGIVGRVRDGQTDGRKLEYWPVGEPGSPEMPRPKDLPLDKPAIEVFDKAVRPIDVLGDAVSHQLVQSDPKLAGYYSQFTTSLDDTQKARLREQYDWARQNEGEKRPYEDWEKASGLPAYFRGYAFKQWDDDFNANAYTPQQRAMFDEMMGYLSGKQPQQPTAGEHESGRDDGEFVKGFKTGVAGMKQSAAAASYLGLVGTPQSRAFGTGALAAADRIDRGETVPMEQDPVGYQDMTQEQRQQFRASLPQMQAETERRKAAVFNAWKEYSAEAKASAGKVPSIFDIHDVQSFSDWLKFTAGQVGPSMATMLAGGVAGGVVGGPAGAAVGVAAPAAVLDIGEIQSDLMDAGAGDRGDLALLYGIPSTALDVWSGGTGRLAKALGRQVVEKEGKGFVRRVLSEAPKSAGEEALQEGAQEALGAGAESQATGKPFLTADTARRIADSAAAGAVGGGAAAPVIVGMEGKAHQPVEQPTMPPRPDLGFTVGQAPADASGRQEPTFTPAPVPDGAIPAESVIGPDPGAQQPQPAAPPAPGRDQLLRDMQDTRTPDQLETAARRERGTGERDAPIKMETAADVARGADVTAEPTPAQAEAGNYQKRHVKWQGLDISVETEAGQTRTGMGPDGPWSVQQPAPYGYFKGTTGRDGDHVDVYLGPQPDSAHVVVIDQIDPATGKFDEHKVMAGFPDVRSATQTYYQAFSDGSGPARLGSLTVMTVPELRGWLASGETKKPLSYRPPAAVSTLSPRGVEAQPGTPPAGVGVEPRPAATVVPKPRKAPALFKNKPMDLIQFLATKGGVRDENGDLKAMDAGRWFYPGLGKFVRPKGLELDYAREAAVEAGYLPADADVNALLDAIRDTLGGNPHYSSLDADRVLEMRQQDERKAAEQRLADTVTSIRSVAKEQRLTATDDEIREAAILALNDGMSPDEALVDVLERSAIMAEQEYAAAAQEAEDAQYAETPFDEPRPAAATRPVEEPAAPQRGPEKPDTGAAEGSPPAGEQRQPDRGDQGQPQEVKPAAAPKDIEGAGKGWSTKITITPYGGKFHAKIEYSITDQGGQMAVPGEFDSEIEARGAAAARLVRQIGTNHTSEAQARTGKEASDWARSQFITDEEGDSLSGRSNDIASLDRKTPAPKPDDGSLRQREAERPVYVSALTRAVDQINQPKAPPSQWQAIIRNLTTKGVKQEEIDWSGVQEWLQQQKGAVPKERVIEFLRTNELPIKEVVKGGPQTDEVIAAKNEFDRYAERLAEKYHLNPQHNLAMYASYKNMDPNEVTEYERLQRAWLASDTTKQDATKFGNYTLPGGENYRELLITLPENDRVTTEPSEAPSGWGTADGGTQGIVRRGDTGADYRSGHFDEPNILAHIRFNERTDADGNKVLFIEEIQSDWHQAGRKKGYRGEQERKFSELKRRHEELNALATEYNAKREPIPESVKSEWAKVSDEMRTLAVNTSDIPDAPLKTTWHELAFRRAARWAAEHDFDKVAWTTGEQQADRFDLSKQISRVEYTQDGRLMAFDKNQNAVINRTIPENELPDVIGKDVAEKLLKQRPIHHSGLTSMWDRARVLVGPDLKVGGDGMRGFYDKILPAYAAKWGKKFEAKVGEMQIVTPYENSKTLRDRGLYAPPDPVVKVHSMDITPSMRESVMGGISMFQKSNMTRRDFVAGAGAAAASAAIPRVAVARNNLTGKEVLGAVKSGNLNDALAWVAENGSTPENKTLARLLTRNGVGKFGIKVIRRDAADLKKMVAKKEISQQAADNANEALGFVLLNEVDKPSLYLVDTGKEQTGLAEETLLHEAIHAYVLGRYRSLSSYLPGNVEKVGMDPAAASPAITEFQDLWNKVSDALLEKYPKQASSRVYEVASSPDELLAYALTDRGIQNELRSLVWDEDAKKFKPAIEPDGKVPSAWDRFVKWLSVLLGVKGKAQITALDKVLSASDTLFDASKVDRPDFKFARAVQDRISRPARAVDDRSVDKTVAGDQTVIPGAERVTDRQLAERRMEGRKKGRGLQKGAEDTPLFDTAGRDQGTLFQREPATAEERQQAVGVMLEMRQPLDRAIRVPFQIFGGIDQRGGWKPGQHLYDKAANIITSAEFSEGGKFAFMNPIMRTVRAGLIDRYGLAPEYVDRERRRALDERKVMVQGAEMVKGLKDHAVGPEEARVLQAVLTGEDVGDADMRRLAQPIREAIDNLGREAVELGLLSPESYERNRGAYLHRVYMKDEANKNSLGRWLNKISISKRKKLIGDQFKGRGMFVDVDLSRLMKDDPEFARGAAGPPAAGQKFALLEETGKSSDLMGDGEHEKVLSRVYWPTDRKVPEKYSGEAWRKTGVWEVRGVKGDKITLWRDFTKAEREKMGEILDARYTIAKTFMLMAHDLANGRFYKDVSENGDWTRTDQPNARWMEASEYSMKHWGDPDIQWIKVPATSISETGGKLKWGALAGKWVRSEIWRDLNEVEQLGRPSLWNKLLTQWKLNKTARSPVVHMNNVMSNLVFMDMADVPMADLVRGIRSYVKQDAHYQEALENGAFGADMVSSELRKTILEPVLKEIEKQNFGGRTNIEARAGVLGKIAEAMWQKAKAVDEKMIDIYKMEDELFRMAMYHRRRQQGFSPKLAADEARQQFLDYDIRAPWVNLARRTVLPFISYTYRAVPVIARSIAAHPWKLAKYFMIMYALNSLAYALAPGDEDEERRSLQDEEQGFTWIGVPRMLRLPFYDGNGHPMFLDIRRWIPAGDVFDMSGSDFLPPWLQFGGPLQVAAELFFNRVAFTGQDIINNLTDNWWDKLGKYSDHLYKSAMPSAPWIPNSWYWQKIERAAKGATDFGGNPYSLPQAAMSSVGIKARGQDVETAFEIKELEFNRIERELKTQTRALQRQLDRGLIDDNTYDKGYERLLNKLDRLDDKRDEVLGGIKR